MSDMDVYETLALDWKPARIYDWTRRCWRDVLLAPWRVGTKPDPDPDAALGESATALGWRVHANDADAPTNKEIVFDLLQQHGPLPMASIALRLDIPYDSAKHAVYDMPTAVASMGRNANNETVYGVIDGVTDPSVRWLNPDSTRAKIAALLAEEGPMSATHVAEKLGLARAQVGKSLRNNVDTFRKVGLLSGYVMYGLVED